MEQEAGSTRTRRRTARPALETDGLRMPPHSVEAEQAVLGGLLLDTSAWDAVADRLRADDFYRRDHQLIFDGIAELVGAQRAERRGHRWPSISRRKGRLDETGGLAYLGGPRARHAHCGQRPRLRGDRPRALAAAPADPRERRDRRERFRERRSQRRATWWTRPSGACSRSPSRAGAPAQASCRSATCSARPSTGSTCCTRTRASSRGVATGFNDLDRKTGGLQPGDLVIVAGRPSMGKTTLARQHRRERGDLERTRPVAIFRMEMSPSS